jgi:TRAP-type uncharacterized transport system substrate-binding protein
MAELDARIFLRRAAAVLTILAVTWLALWYLIPAPPSTITIGAGLKGGPFEHIALRYRERLARHHVKLNIRFSKSSLDTVQQLHDPKSGLDAAFLLGSATNSVESPELVSLGRISYSPIWFFYRSQEPIEHLSQLKGKRISLSLTSGRMTTKILAAYGITPQNTNFLALVSTNAVKALRAGEVDVISFSQEADAPNIHALMHDPMLRVMNVAHAEALTQLFPSINHLVLAQGVTDLENNIPPSDVNLISLTNAVVARANLHPEIIFLLAQTMKEEDSRGGIFYRAGDFPTQTDPELPIAEEALDYYKNGPSFMQRYLPFWMINYVKRMAAIIVTAIAVVIPLFTYTPRLYTWFLRTRMARLYRRLRAVDAQLQKELTAAEVNTLQIDLENISRSANILPVRHSDLFFGLMGHIDLTRTRLAARLFASEKKAA